MYYVLTASATDITVGVSPASLAVSGSMPNTARLYPISNATQMALTVTLTAAASQSITAANTGIATGAVSYTGSSQAAGGFSTANDVNLFYSTATTAITNGITALAITAAPAVTGVMNSTVTFAATTVATATTTVSLLFPSGFVPPALLASYVAGSGAASAWGAFPNTYVLSAVSATTAVGFTNTNTAVAAGMRVVLYGPVGTSDGFTTFAPGTIYFVLSGASTSGVTLGLTATASAISGTIPVSTLLLVVSATMNQWVSLTIPSSTATSLSVAVSGVGILAAPTSYTASSPAGGAFATGAAPAIFYSTSTSSVAVVTVSFSTAPSTSANVGAVLASQPVIATTQLRANIFAVNVSSSNSGTSTSGFTSATFNCSGSWTSVVSAGYAYTITAASTGSVSLTGCSFGAAGTYYLAITDLTANSATVYSSAIVISAVTPTPSASGASRVLSFGLVTVGMVLMGGFLTL